jgi:hypothetical protein
MVQKRLFSVVVFSLAMLAFTVSILANPQNSKRTPSAADQAHARVVSLSFVAGTVIARSPGSPKWARATLNMPVQEGVSIATGRHSLAEVQFEDGSTVRLGEVSRLDFEQMALGPHSHPINHFVLVVGLATINIVAARHDEYALTVSRTSVLPRDRSEFRTDFRHEDLRVEVFKGRVRVADSDQTDELKKHQALALDYRPHGAFQVTNQIQMDQWDKWVQARDRQVHLAEYMQQASVFDPWGGWILFPPVSGDDGF